MYLKTEILKALSFKKTVRLPLSYWLLVLIRFLLTLLPQTGYIHPDEFFQNVEVIAGDIFPIDVARTWEFNPKFPIRNIFVPKMILGPPLYLIQSLNPMTSYFLNIDLKKPYYLLMIPRLFICFLSLINDYCLYKICVAYGQNFRNRLTVFASSYVVLVYCCRSFSNAFETILFSMLLYLVAECMLKSDKVIYHDEFLKKKYQQATTAVEKVKLFKLKSHLPEHSMNWVAVLATIVVVGIFNRPTFVGFAFPPIFFWLHRGLGSKVVGFKDFHHRIFTFILCGIPIFLLLVLVDSAYYGYITMADIESSKISWDNWVVTPLNFLRYNTDMKNLSEHGIHPRWLHLVVNVPLLFNVLGIRAVIVLSGHLYRFFRGQYKRLPRIQSITGLMMFSLVIPVAVLSLFPHQEARFITPVILPLVFLYGNRFFPNETDAPRNKKLKTTLRYVWYITNIILTVFFGFVHQAGIYHLAKNLHYEIKSIYALHTHVITTHSYSIPTYLLQIESTTKIYKDRRTGHTYRLAPTTFLHKCGSMPMNELFAKIDDTLTNAETLLRDKNRQYKFYVASPCSLEEKIRKEGAKYHHIDLEEESSIYPHFSSEALPEFPDRRDQYCSHYNPKPLKESLAVDLTLSQRISCYFSRFCLRIYRVRPGKKSHF